MDMIIETHIDLMRQGPGSVDATLKALSFVDTNLDVTTAILDLGCGTGGQTMTLAQNTRADIIAMDLIPEFVRILNTSARQQGFGDRVTGITGDMNNLPFKDRRFDLIWSEGAIDSIGFEQGLSYWHEYLKPEGFVAVTCPTRLSDQLPDEVQQFWLDAGSELNSLEHNLAAMQRAGYTFVAAFVLPEECWTDNYFLPRDKAEEALADRYPGNRTVAACLKASVHEKMLYTIYGQHYGYVFYIGKRM